jgi:hypothetical protein
MINPKVANLQISTKKRTTLSQNTPKICICKRFYVGTNLNYSITFYFCTKKKYVFADMRKSCKSANYNKAKSENRKSAMYTTFAESPQII